MAQVDSSDSDECDTLPEQNQTMTNTNQKPSEEDQEEDQDEEQDEEEDEEQEAEQEAEQEEEKFSFESNGFTGGSIEPS